MAKQTDVKVNSSTTKRRGIHAKSQTSKIKGSKNYVKLNKGQGR